MSNPRPPLLIVGASGRAAATSAWRAGFAPTVVDLFADRDLNARFPAHRVGRSTYPGALADVAATFPDAPWIYTGAIENHPALIDRIGRSRRLLGIGGDALIASRDPRRWTAALRDDGFSILDCRLPGDCLPTRGRWFLKPLDSASGRGITVGNHAAIPNGSYLQKRVDGLPLGAIFIGEGGSARMVGITRQLLGRNEHGLKVAYRGSVGPVAIDREIRDAIARIGVAIASNLGLVIDLTRSHRRAKPSSSRGDGPSPPWNGLGPTRPIHSPRSPTCPRRKPRSNPATRSLPCSQRGGRRPRFWLHSVRGPPSGDDGSTIGPSTETRGLRLAS